MAAGHGMGLQVNKDIHADSIAKFDGARENWYNKVRSELKI